MDDRIMRHGIISSCHFRDRKALTVLVTGPTATQSRRFFPGGGRNHHQHSLRLPTEGWPG